MFLKMVFYIAVMTCPMLRHCSASGWNHKKFTISKHIWLEWWCSRLNLWTPNHTYIIHHFTLNLSFNCLFSIDSINTSNNRIIDWITLNPIYFSKVDLYQANTFIQSHIDRQCGVRIWNLGVILSVGYIPLLQHSSYIDLKNKEREVREAFFFQILFLRLDA